VRETRHYTNRQATVPYNIESFRLLFLHRFHLRLSSETRTFEMREKKRSRLARECVIERERSWYPIGGNCELLPVFYFTISFSLTKYNSPKINSIWNLYARSDAISTNRRSNILHNTLSTFFSKLFLHLPYLLSTFQAIKILPFDTLIVIFCRLKLCFYVFRKIFDIIK